MGHFFVRQPNKKIAIFSTIVDDFILINVTEKECIKHEAKRAAEDERERCKRHLEEIDNYPGRFPNWEKCLRTILAAHKDQNDCINGKKRVGELKKIVERRSMDE